MDIPISVILTIVGILVTLLITKYGIMKSDFDEKSKTNSRLTRLETNEETFKAMSGKVDQVCTKVASLETNETRLWNILGPQIALNVHSPVHVRRDALMDKLFNTHDITFQELCELQPMLAEAANDVNGEKPKRYFFAMAQYRVETLIANEEGQKAC